MDKRVCTRTRTLGRPGPILPGGHIGLNVVLVHVLPRQAIQQEGRGARLFRDEVGVICERMIGQSQSTADHSISPAGAPQQHRQETPTYLIVPVEVIALDVKLVAAAVEEPLRLGQVVGVARRLDMEV